MPSGNTSVSRRRISSLEAARPTRPSGACEADNKSIRPPAANHSVRRLDIGHGPVGVNVPRLDAVVMIEPVRTRL